MSKITVNPNDVLRQMAQQMGLKPFTLTAPNGMTYETYVVHQDAPELPNNGLTQAEKLRRARLRRAQAAYWTPARRAEHGKRIAAIWASKRTGNK